MLKLIVGNDSNSMKLMLDGEDIADRMHVAKAEITLLPNEATKVVLNVYAGSEIEVLPKNVTVNVSPEATGYNLSSKRVKS